MSEILLIHALVERSRSNGPGTRAVVWVQGCTLGCTGCFNPETHASEGGRQVRVLDLAEQIGKLGREGVTGLSISGGEPLQQVAAVGALIAAVRSREDMSVLIFTGFSWEEIQASPEKRAVVGAADVVIAGRFDTARRQKGSLMASANQTVHFPTGRHGPAELMAVPESELLISPDGSIVATGIAPVRLGQRPGASAPLDSDG